MTRYLLLATVAAPIGQGDRLAHLPALAVQATRAGLVLFTRQGRPIGSLHAPQWRDGFVVAAIHPPLEASGDDPALGKIHVAQLELDARSAGFAFIAKLVPMTVELSEVTPHLAHLSIERDALTTPPADVSLIN